MAGGTAGGTAARACPEVMAVQWKHTDKNENRHGGGGGGGGGGGSVRPALSVQSSSEGAQLSVYRVMLASTFCLQPGGDSPTRKGIYDAIAAQW